jgi:hypothetical protein
MERAICEYKYRIRSTRSPDVNAINILVELAAARRRQRVLALSESATGVTDQELECDARADDTFQMMGPMGSIKACVIMPDRQRITVGNIINRFIDRWGDRDSTVPSNAIIQTGSNIVSSSGMSAGCSDNHSNNSRCDFFVKMEIDALALLLAQLFFLFRPHYLLWYILLINKSPFKKTSCFLVVVAAVVC